MAKPSLSDFDSHKDVGTAVQSCRLVWIEIELVDEEDQPVPGEEYRIELPGGKTVSGSLDFEGFAHIDGIERGNCKITFPNLDGDAWERI
jgi:hypothetical protein